MNDFRFLFSLCRFESSPKCRNKNTDNGKSEMQISLKSLEALVVFQTNLYRHISQKHLCIPGRNIEEMTEDFSFACNQRRKLHSLDSKQKPMQFLFTSRDEM